ncbi:hypothetical protein KL921_000903 [Ogataea angusta]|uniref:Integrase zinc-binding domain-containing protein n=1 Tax=Pichia angusta TaxID=870730 RepID=A0AAN6DIL6_PICAN|nr:uncharacterized protein KL928_001071 [Ogataea angusta]KAG7813357.1 hypothetical protein KL921_000903 [Ogataea angusta]KAG7820987.1 hypothetical protein KL928_001071 [Ogataea angusta]KAG7826312.1 hypothetical protein KL909_000364 [Ogataea angusta]KAG7831941.1 hypothetical protein KL920_000276 [Ogataea angusta]KAG7836113.1 hypothetical protein KL943_001762 [Ogataea angusta]
MGGFNNVILSNSHFVPHYNVSTGIERLTVLLKDKETTATIYPIFSSEDLPFELLRFLTQEYNDEIARGDTQPFFEPLTIDEFRDYWFGQFAAVMVLGDDPTLDTSWSHKEWAKRCLGTFFIKASYPGRCAHVATANILVNAGIREKGIGRILAECFLAWAPKLSYTYAMMELIFETNAAAKTVLESLHFKKVGRIKGCGLLKSSKDSLIDAITYGRELDPPETRIDQNSKYEKIRNFILTRKYPDDADRQEKSRLRALASHYTVENGHLYLKGKEVIMSQKEQLRITKDAHERGHIGINKTTSYLCDRYHWPKIKEMVTQVVKACPECKDPTLLSLKRSTVPTPKLRTKSPRPHYIHHQSPNSSLSQQPPDIAHIYQNTHIDSTNPLNDILAGSGISDVVEMVQRQHRHIQEPHQSHSFADYASHYHPNIASNFHYDSPGDHSETPTPADSQNLRYKTPNSIPIDPAVTKSHTQGTNDNSDVAASSEIDMARALLNSGQGQSRN